MPKLITLLFLSILLCVSIQAQENLLKNPNAEDATKNWIAYGDAKIEEFDNNQRFVLKNGGYFLQDIILSKQSTGKYALLIGVGSSERVFFDDNITDHPYLYGYLMTKVDKISQYLLGQNTLWGSKVKNEWKCMWGIYEIAEGDSTVRFFLMQAARKGTERNGSAARFDNLGLYIFDKRAEADKFVVNFCSENN